MNHISRPIVVLLVVGVVLGLFALAGRKGGSRPEGTATTSPTAPAAPAGAAAPRDASAALESLVSLLNKNDAAKLRQQFTVPFYLEGKKIEDEQSLDEFVQKAVERPHAFAVESAVQMTAREAGLPPEADDVLTSNDIILVADLRDNGEPARRIFVFRKTSGGLKVLAILKSPEQ